MLIAPAMTHFFVGTECVKSTGTIVEAMEHGHCRRITIKQSPSKVLTVTLLSLGRSLGLLVLSLVDETATGLKGTG